MRYVAGDWGTSRLRLWLVSDGAVLDAHEGPGIAALAALPPEARAAHLAALLLPWHEGHIPLPVRLAGMAGSRNGLFEVPYARAPAAAGEWAAAARTCEVAGLRVSIAAGVAARDGGAPPDVMRGEETQLFGALALDPALRDGKHLAVLPGTHSKWVELEGAAIGRFRTCITGELYALLTQRSMLLAAGAAAAAEPSAEREAGFAAGLARAEDASGIAALFEARAAQLLDGRSRDWAAGWLSGLLIGCEVRELSATFDPAAGVLLIGASRLAERYARALARRGIAARRMDDVRCTLAGLTLLEEAGHA